VAADQFVDDGQADAAAADLAGAAPAVEPSRYMRQFVGRDADARVAHPQYRLVTGWSRLHDDLAAGRRELGRVDEQVRDHLAHPGPIASGVDHGQPPHQADAGVVEDVGEAVGDGSGQGGQVARRERELYRRGLGRSQPLQVVDHPAEPDRLVVQRLHLVGRQFGDAVQHRLGDGLQDRDRRAQLVGGVGHEVATQLVLLADVVGHLIEGCRQLADVTEPPDLADPGMPVTRASRPDCPEQPVHRSGDHGCQEEGHDQPEERSEPRGAEARLPTLRLEVAHDGSDAAVIELQRHRPDSPAAGPYERRPNRPWREAGIPGRGPHDPPGQVPDLHRGS